MDKNNRIGWTRRDFTWPGVMLEQPLSIVPCARYRHYDSDELLAIVRQVQNKLIKWTEVEKNYIDGITRVPPTAVRKILYPKEKAAEKIEALMVSGLPKMGPQYHCNLPVVAKSAISQPIAAQPAVAQCVAAQPAVSRPVVAQPAVSRPVVAQPAVSRPVVAQPAVAQLVAVQPATVLSAQPTQPATAQLAALQPTADQPARPAGPATSTQPTIALTASTQHPASEADDVRSAALSSASAADAVDAEEMETVEGEGEALEECEVPRAPSAHPCDHVIAPLPDHVQHPVHVIPCHAVPYHTIPHHTMPYHTTSHPIFRSKRDI